MLHLQSFAYILLYTGFALTSRSDLVVRFAFHWFTAEFLNYLVIILAVMSDQNDVIINAQIPHTLHTYIYIYVYLYIYI